MDNRLGARSCSHLVHAVDVGNDVQTHIRALVFELRQKHWQEMLDGVVLAQDRREAHDHRRQGGLDVLVGVGHKLLDVRQYVLHDDRFALVGRQKLAEVFDFVSDGNPDLGLAVLQQILSKNRPG